MKFSIPIGFLILSNLIPVFGLIFFDWRLQDIPLFFMADLVAICFFTVLKVIFLSNENLKPVEYDYTTQTSTHSAFQLSKLPQTVKKHVVLTTPFQIKRHTIFIILLVSMMGLAVTLGIVSEKFDIPTDRTIFLYGLVPFFSHFISFIINYLHGNEYKTVKSESLIMKHVARITVTLLTIGFGAQFGKYGIVICIILFKTFADYIAHVNEHKGLYFDLSPSAPQAQKI